jgi:hypothetical protein
MQLIKRYKLILFIALIFLVSSKANGQVIIALLFGDKLNSDKLEFGLSGGFNSSHISSVPDSKSKNGFVLGLYLDFKLSPGWHLLVEAVPKFPTGVSKLKPYSLDNPALDSLLQSGDVTRKIKNIALPLLVRYKLNSHWLVETGPQLNLRTKAKDIFQSGDLSYENDIVENITRFDFGWTIGIVRKLNKEPKAAGIGLRYYFGLTDIDKQLGGSQKNGVFQVLFSIPVGTGKKQQK